MGLYLVLMGVQGAGKGVQASYIEEKYQIPHVSTGDLFRAMKQRDDELARRVQQILNSGQLVDDATTNEIVADRLNQSDAANGAILDGYPRNQNQAEFLSRYLASKEKKVNAVLLLELDLYVAFKRAFGRVTAPDGTSYNIYTNRDGIEVHFEEDPAGKYPARVVAKRDGEELQRRSDDANAAAVIKRIDTYLESTQPLIDYYDERGLLKRVDAEQSIENVQAQISEIIESTT